MDNKASTVTERASKEGPVENVTSHELGEITIPAVVDLAALGLQEETTRNMGFLALMGMAWNISNCWAGVSATIAIGITQGGTITILYGMLVVLLLAGASVLTLAELASVYPTAGGQYHFTSILAPTGKSKSLSYFCGAANIFSWVATNAGIVIIPAQIIIGLVLFFDPEFEAPAWKTFLLYQAFNLLFVLNNIFFQKRANWIHDIGLFLSISFFIIILVACLAMSPTKQTSSFVWTTWVDESNWNAPGLVFFFGLVNPAYAFGGIDGALHLAEEASNAAIIVPKVITWTLVIGFLSSFPFMIAMLYCISDLDAVLGTITGQPMLELWYQATQSKAAATVFTCSLLWGGCFALNGAQQTASRLTWSFARDNGFIFSNYLGHIHPTLDVPVWSLIANGVVVFIIGCIYLGSTTAFNAFIGSGLLLGQISYAIPAALLLYQKRSSQYLPASRGYKLPGIIGWASNILTIVYAVIMLIFWDFPTALPTTGSTMNYTCAVLGVMVIFAVVNWYIHARHHYRGPRLGAHIFTGYE